MATLRLCLRERNVENLKLQNVMVVFDPPEHAKEAYTKHGKLRPGEQYLFVGEVKNMPGHGVFVDPGTGATWCGYHLENFYLLMEGIKVVEGKTEYDETQYTIEEQGEEVCAQGIASKEDADSVWAAMKAAEETARRLRETWAAYAKTVR